MMLSLGGPIFGANGRILRGPAILRGRVLHPLHPTKLFLTLFFLTVFTAAGSSDVAALVTVQGDLPADSLTYDIELYNATQGGACDQIADPGTYSFNLTNTTLNEGDSSYDDDDDYRLSFDPGADGDASPDFVQLVWCQGGTEQLRFNFNAVDATTYTFDLAKIKGNTHDDLDNDYITVCDNLNGNVLNSKPQQVDVPNNNYNQYYYINESSGDTEFYALFDDDSSNDCKLDSTKSTGYIIDLTSSDGYINFGVFPTFSPIRKAVGDAHLNLTDARMDVYESSTLRHRGLANITRSGAPDGLDNGDNDYILYYFNLTAPGDLTLNITPSNPAVPSSHVTTVTGIADSSFTSGYDFVIDIEDSQTDQSVGGVVADIDSVEVGSIVVGGDSITYSTIPVLTPGGYDEYDLFVDLDSASEYVLLYLLRFFKFFTFHELLDKSL